MPPVVLLKSASKPTAVFWTPVVLLKSANAPLAVFWLPVVLLKSAPAPVAVFSPAVLARSAPAPRAVFNWPVVSLLSEKKPTAVLNPPVVRLKSADWPSAVLPPGYPPSGPGTTACVLGKRMGRSARVIRSAEVVCVFIARVLKNLANLSRPKTCSRTPLGGTGRWPVLFGSLPKSSSHNSPSLLPANHANRRE